MTGTSSWLSASILSRSLTCPLNARKATSMGSLILCRDLGNRNSLGGDCEEARLHGDKSGVEGLQTLCRTAS